jgi:hypothetical protein
VELDWEAIAQIAPENTVTKRNSVWPRLKALVLDSVSDEPVCDSWFLFASIA